MAFRSKNYSHF